MTIDKGYAKLAKINNCKIVVGGDGAVGKTTIAQRLVGKLKEEEERFMTCGIDFHSLEILDGDFINAQIWDLGGQEHFRDFQGPFFDSAHIIVIVFSVDWFQSFLNLDNWTSIIEKYNPLKVFLIGNKIDSENRAVSEDTAREYAEDHKMIYHEISALTGKGIQGFKEDLLKSIKVIFSLEENLNIN